MPSMMNSTLPAVSASASLTLQLLTVSIITLQRTRYHNSIDPHTAFNQTYDYIVVGAGSAGSIVASRLSENSSVSVLVLEAGGPETVLTDMPAMERRILGSEVDWGFRTTPQRGAGWAYGGRVPIPRGRVVGGSHNLNYVVYSRGNRRDFDSWEQEFGATGWGYNSVLPYFLRSENNTDRSIVSANPAFHSTSGRMAVMTPSNADGIILKYMDMMLANGVPLADQNGPSQMGVNLFQQTIFPNGTRATTASAYLEPYVKIRANLRVITKAFARQIILNHTRDGLRAQGIVFENNGTNNTVYARKEVILSAEGSINSPQLLMLSGIGPRDHLSQFGIDTLVNLPVGYNLKDHVHVQLDLEVLNSSMVTSGNQLSVDNLYQYYTNGSGPLSQFPLVYQYMNSPYNNQTDWPDIQVDLNIAPVGNNLTALVHNKAVNVREWEDYYRPHLGQNNRLVLLCFHYRPRSVGRLYLQSSDPHVYPLLDTNYLSDPYDTNALVDAIRKALLLSMSGDFARYTKLWRQPIPGCSLCTDRAIWQCESYLECYARSITNTVGHQVGTCKMGSGTDTVVDPRLRVRGVLGLRVADASVYPTITNGNTNAPTIMIGEYGAQMIRDDNQT